MCFTSLFVNFEIVFCTSFLNVLTHFSLSSFSLALAVFYYSSIQFSKYRFLFLWTDLITERISMIKSVYKQKVVGSNGLEPSTSRLSGVRSNHLSYEPMKDGGDEEDRTPDPLLAKQVLSQLSYTPKFSSDWIKFREWTLKIKQHTENSIRYCTDHR